MISNGKICDIGILNFRGITDKYQIQQIICRMVVRVGFSIKFSLL